MINSTTEDSKPDNVSRMLQNVRARASIVRLGKRFESTLHFDTGSDRGQDEFQAHHIYKMLLNGIKQTL